MSGVHKKYALSGVFLSLWRDPSRSAQRREAAGCLGRVADTSAREELGRATAANGCDEIIKVMPFSFQTAPEKAKRPPEDSSRAAIIINNMNFALFLGGGHLKG
jgi:hypothetical protein